MKAGQVFGFIILLALSMAAGYAVSPLRTDRADGKQAIASHVERVEEAPQETLEEEAAVEEVSQEAGEPARENSGESVMSTEALMSRLNFALSSVYDKDYSVSIEGDSIIVKRWADTITAALALVATGHEDQITDYDKSVDAAKEYCDVIQKAVESFGRSETVYFNAVSADDHNALFLSVSRGEVLYSAVDDAHKRTSSTEVVEESAPTTEPENKRKSYRDIASLTDADVGPLDTSGLRLTYGDLQSVNYGGDGVVVIKAKIKGQTSNKLTIQQNYHNVADLITKEGFNVCQELQYWAVMDVRGGGEIKVISFTLYKNVIDAVKYQTVLPTNMGDYVSDLYIYPGLQG